MEEKMIAHVMVNMLHPLFSKGSEQQEVIASLLRDLAAIVEKGGRGSEHLLYRCGDQVPAITIKYPGPGDLVGIELPINKDSSDFNLKGRVVSQEESNQCSLFTVEVVVTALALYSMKNGPIGSDGLMRVSELISSGVPKEVRERVPQVVLAVASRDLAEDFEEILR